MMEKTKLSRALSIFNGLGNGSIAAGVAALFLFASPDMAQPLPVAYRVIELEPIRFDHSRGADLSDSGIAAGTGPVATIWVDGEPIDLGNPTDEGFSIAYGVNDFGMVAGAEEGEHQTQIAYVWQDGVWTEVGSLPGLPYSRAVDVNNMGVVVGNAYQLGGAWQSFVWLEGEMTDLGNLGTDYTRAHAINEMNQVTGTLTSADIFGLRGFIWEGGEFTVLDPLPFNDESQGRGLNDAGEVVGSSWITIFGHGIQQHAATMWTGSERVELGHLPGFATSIANDVNDLGVVVGHARHNSSGAPVDAWVWHNGVMRDLQTMLIRNTSGLNLSDAVAINDRGVILCNALTRDERLRTCLLVPVYARSTRLK